MEEDNPGRATLQDFVSAIQRATKGKGKGKGHQNRDRPFFERGNDYTTNGKGTHMGSPLGKNQGHNTRMAKARQKVGKEKIGVEHGKGQKSTWQNNGWKGKGPNPWQFNQPLGSAIQKGTGKGKGNKGKDKAKFGKKGKLGKGSKSKNHKERLSNWK